MSLPEIRRHARDSLSMPKDAATVQNNEALCSRNAAVKSFSHHDLQRNEGQLPGQGRHRLSRAVSGLGQRLPPDLAADRIEPDNKLDAIGAVRDPADGPPVEPTHRAPITRDRPLIVKIELPMVRQSEPGCSRLI